MRIIGVILARLSSTRLPGKALCDIGGQPLIHYVIQRARSVRNISNLVLATSNTSLDDPLANHAEAMGLKVFRGSQEHVAARCVECSNSYKAEFFVRFNGDSPCIDPLLIEQAIETITLNPTIDLATNLLSKTFPYGISVEVVRTSALQELLPALDAADAEHVTRYFYKNTSEFRIHQIVSQTPELAKARLTVDTPDDLERFRKLAVKLGRDIEVANYKALATAYLDLFHD